MKSDVNKTLFRIIKIAGTFLIVLLVVYGTLRASMVAFDFGYRVFTEPAMADKPGTTVVVTIEESMGAMEIADALFEKGLIRDVNLFWLQYQLSAYKGDILPGTYSLNTSMTPKELMVEMAEVAAEAKDLDEESVQTVDDTQISDDSEAE